MHIIQLFYRCCCQQSLERATTTAAGMTSTCLPKYLRLAIVLLKRQSHKKCMPPPTIIFAKIFHQASVQRVRLFSTLVKTSLNYSNCKFENLTSNPKTINLKIGHLFKALYSTGILQVLNCRFIISTYFCDSVFKGMYFINIVLKSYMTPRGCLLDF